VALAESDVEKRLLAATKDPGGDLIALTKWYGELGIEDRSVVVEFLQRWLDKRDLHRAGIVFNFLSEVEPLQALEPAVLEYAEAMDELFMRKNAASSASTLWYDLGLYVWTLARLKSRAAIPWLRRWAQACASSRRDRAVNGVTSAVALLAIDLREGLSFASMTLKGDMAHRPGAIGTKGAISMSEQYVMGYLRHCDDIRPLTKAYAALDHRERQAALVVLKQVVAEDTRLYRLGVPRYPHFSEDWARRIVESFIQMLDLE